MARKILSIQDGDLNVPSIITSKNKNYSDIDLIFANRKDTGDIYKKIDGASVSQALKNLILTNHFEKPFNPYFGANLHGLLFDNADEDIEEDIVENIRLAINNFEPRVRILEIDINSDSDNNSLSVRLLFQIINTSETVTLNTSLTRIR